MIWTKDLEHLTCPECGARGTLRYVPGGSHVNDERDALRFVCTVTVPEACGFSGYDDEAPLMNVLVRLRSEQVNSRVAR